MIRRAIRRGVWSLLIGVALLLAAKSPVHACGTVVKVTYVESSPDVFLIEYPDGQDDLLQSVKIDLTTSAAGAYVDTFYGPGRSNADDAVRVDLVQGFAEGGQVGTVTFKAFAAGDRFTLLVDLDDRGLSGEPDPDHLIGNELKGGKVTARLRSQDGASAEMHGVFDEEGVATLGSPACA